MHSTLCLWLLAQVASPAAPRAVTEAALPDVSDLLYVQHVDEHLAPVLDAFERVAGTEAAEAFLEEAPLPYLALQRLAGHARGARWMRLGGGLGLMRSPRFEGPVGLLAVDDEALALRETGDFLVEGGARRAPQARDYALYTLADGGQMALFTDRGFLYLAMPESATAARGLRRLVRAVRSAPAQGLEGDPGFRRLTAQVQRGAVWMFQRQPLGEKSPARAVLLSARLDDRGVRVDGFVESAAPLLEALEGPTPSVLSEAPSGAAAAFSARVPPHQWLALLLGEADNPERALWREVLGLGGGQAVGLTAGLSGALAAVVYADPGAWVEQAAAEDPEPVGAPLLPGELRLELGVPESATARWVDLVSRLLQVPQVRARRGGAALVLEAGSAPGKGGGPVDLTRGLRGGLGPQAFGPGHVTAVLDLARVRAQLNAWAERERPEGVRRWVAAELARRWLRVDRMALDLAPESQGVRLTAECVYRLSRAEVRGEAARGEPASPWALAR